MHYVTQSEIKKMLEYESGACGLQIEHELKKPSFPSAVMRLGIYFEYLVTGTPPRSGVIPEPERTATGKKELTAPYKVVTNQAERVKTYLKRMGISYEAGLWRTNSKLMIGAHLDLVGSSAVLGEFVMDLKYSGNVDDKWSNYGWMWTEQQRIYNGIQAIHYHLVTGLPFYYLVAESKEKGAVKLFKTEFSDGAIENHLRLIDRTRDFLQEMKLGLNPAPEVTRCETCPIYENCNHRAIYPEVKFVSI